MAGRSTTPAPAAGRRTGGDAATRLRPHAFKVCVPDSLCGGLLGSRGGSGTQKDEIQNDSGARLVLSNREEHYPSTRLRIIIVHADEPQQIMTALDRLVEKTVECAHSERDTRIAQEFLGRAPGEIAFHASVPKAMSEVLIGPQGVCLGQLMHETGAQVLPDRDAYDGHLLLRILGTPGMVKSVLDKLLMVIDRSSGHEAFLSWASLRAFPSEPAMEVDPCAASALEAFKQWAGHGYGGAGGAGGHGGGGGPDGYRDRGPDRGGGRDRRPEGRDSRSRPPPPRPPRGDAVGQASDRPRERERERDRGGRGDDRRREDRGSSRPRPPAPPPPVAPPPPGPPPGPAPGGWRSSPIFEALAVIADEFVEGGLENDFSVSCDLPYKRCGALIGKRGEYVDFVERMTGARVKFENNEARGAADGMRTMSIVGRLLPVYAAHMLMMKRYLDTEAQEGFLSETPDRLRLRLEELQAMARGAAPPAGGSRPSPPRDERVAAEDAYYDVEALKRLKRKAEDAGYLDLGRRHGSRSRGGSRRHRSRSEGRRRSRSKRDRRRSHSRSRSRRGRGEEARRGRSTPGSTQRQSAGQARWSGGGKGDGAAIGVSAWNSVPPPGAAFPPPAGMGGAGAGASGGGAFGAEAPGFGTGGAGGANSGKDLTAQPDGNLPEPSFTVETEAGKHRCALTLWLPPRGSAQAPRSFQMRGPKRDKLEVADMDGERMMKAFREGGESEARRVQRALQDPLSQEDYVPRESDNMEDGPSVQSCAEEQAGEPAEDPMEGGMPEEHEPYAEQYSQEQEQYPQDQEHYPQDQEPHHQEQEQYPQEPQEHASGFIEDLLGGQMAEVHHEEDFAVRCWGEGIPGPIADWDEAEQQGLLAPEVRNCLGGSLGFPRPTLAQRYAVPVVAAQLFDLVLEAPPGAGKTLAYLLPLVSRLVGPQPARPHTPGPAAQASPLALLLSPTRELAVQTSIRVREVVRAIRANVTTLLLTSGEAPVVQTKPIERQQFDVVCATPGRLVDVLDDGKLSLGFVSTVVLDEVDQLLGQQELESAVGDLLTGRDLPAEGRQTILVSNAFPQFADTVRSWLRPPSEIAAVHIGLPSPAAGSGAAGDVEAVEQRLTWVNSDQERWGRVGQDLANLLRECEPAPRRAIVFANRIIQASALVNVLKKPPYSLRCAHVHSKLAEDSREEAMQSFVSGEADVLVATNLGGQGLQLPGAAAVLQADLPTDVEAYAQRIGCAGRGGAPGKSLAYLGPKDTSLAPALLEFLQQHNQAVPPWLPDLASGAGGQGQ